jgi:hypothetical protein
MGARIVDPIMFRIPMQRVIEFLRIFIIEILINILTLNILAMNSLYCGKVQN